MSQRKVRVGVAGVGFVAEHIYLPAMPRIPELEVVAVCDIVPELAKRIQGKFGIQECYFDIQDMLYKSDIEAVAVLSSMQSHTKLGLAAIAAGKHVYIEKPMAGCMEDANTLISEAKKAGVLLAAAPATILNPNLAHIKRLLVERKEIGKICWVRAHASHPGPGRAFARTADVTWFYKPGGGPLFDLGVYAIQELVYLLGPAKRVMAMTGTAVPSVTIRSGPAEGKHCVVEVDDLNLALLDFGDDTYAFIDATFCVWAFRGPTREFYGSDGVLTVNPWGSRPPFEIYKEDYVSGMGGWMAPAQFGLDEIIRRQKNPIEEYSLATGVQHLAQCIMGGGPVVISGERARHTLEIMLGITESGRTGKSYELTTSI